jgi:hypothetical protein
MSQPRARFASRAGWPLLATLILFAITLAVSTLRSVRAADGHFIYAIDDGYIQMAIGKNLGAHGIWGVTPYGFSGSGSSLLWPLLLALCRRALGPHDWLALALNAISAVLVLAIASSVLRRHGVSPILRLATLSAMVVGLPLAILAVYGMEHTLQTAVALGMAALAARVHAERGAADRFFVPVALGSALMMAVRYDLASVLAPSLVVMAPRMRLRKTVAVLGCAAAPCIAYAIVAWRHHWPPLPASILLKEPTHALDFSSWRGWVNAAAGHAAHQLVSSPPLFVLVLISVVLLVESRREERALGVESQALLIVFLIASLLHAQFDLVDWPFRYEAYLITLGLVAVASGFAHAMTRPRRSPWLTAPATRLVVAAAIACALVRQGYLAQRGAIESTAFLYRQPVQVGRFLKKFPRRGSVMIDDYLGTFAYFSDARLVDLFGLARYDVALALRAVPAGRDLAEAIPNIASTNDARTAVMAGWPPTMLPGWTCVSQWSGGEPLAFYAASLDEAKALEVDLAAFDRELPPPIRREPCASPARP